MVFQKRKEIYVRGEGIRGTLVLFIVIIATVSAILGLLILMSKTEQKQMDSSFEVVSLEEGKILVKNTGEAAIKKGELSVYINSQKIDASNEDIRPGQVGAIQINESKAGALVSVRLGEQTKSMPIMPAITTTTTIPDKICPAVCVQMWQLKKNSCIYTDCGSGCGPDNVATFGTETECKQKIAATSITTSTTPTTSTSSCAYVPSSMTFSPISVQAGTPVIASSLFGGACNGKSLQLREDSCAGTFAGSCTISNGACSVSFTPTAAKSYKFIYCEGGTSTQHLETLIVTAAPTISTSASTSTSTSISTSTSTSTPSTTTSTSVTAPVIGGDLDVAYIERTPKYPRYRVTYFADRRMCEPENTNYYPYSEDRGPQLCPGESGKKRWPDGGETVTFTAYIKNNDNIATGAFGFKWFIDGTEVKSSSHTSIGTGQTENEIFQWTWPSDLNDHKVKFVADPSNIIAEKFETNNQIEDFTNALYFFIAINNAAYNSLKSQVGNSKPSPPEDWIRNQINRMSSLFSSNGVLERLRIDKIVISDSDFSTSEKYNADGTWFINSDYRTTSGYYDSTEDIDYGLLHELIHQLGIIDLYQMNSDTQYDKLQDKKYNRVGAGCGTEYGWPNVWDCYSIASAQPSIGNDLANNVAHQIGSHTGNALNKNLHKRRGYFGEYLFDTPSTIKVKFLKSSGQPLDSATIKVYQSGMDRIIDPTKLKQSLTADVNGMITLEPVTGSWASPTTTETGHQLKSNPFGLISVVGQNGLFLFEIEKNGFDYKWLPLALANVEYWKGSTTEATFTITTTLA
ncbi:MAG: hypothetical protein HYT72_01740 [Candidatus Aenigmarchaeota archaeon]|nr:hypothetical protein [Candidatus Aenigmarchaeota archaeon]